jgi:hypothetical protein
VVAEIGIGGTIPLDAVYRDGAMVATDPTDPLVSVIDSDGAVRLAPTTPATHPAVGLFVHPYTVPAAGPLGVWTARWYGLVNGVEVGPVDDPFAVVAAGSVAFPDGSGLAGPCAAWEPIWCCELTAAQEAVTGTAVAAATEVYWALSGRQFGECQVTLRPCREDCVPAGWSGPAWGGGPVPALIDGQWLNLVCGSCAGECSCSALSEFVLPGPVARVVEIVVDGAVVPTGSYRVDDWRRVVRTDGGRWPACNDLSKPATEPGTWQVTAAVGAGVPTLGRMAVGELACEIAKGCAGDDDCRLPFNVVQLVRQGVTISFPTIMELLEAGVLGMEFGDLFIRTYNPGGLASRPLVLTPDRPRHRRAGT